jgi:hypothetical protein
MHLHGLWSSDSLPFFWSAFRDLRKNLIAHWRNLPSMVACAFTGGLKRPRAQLRNPVAPLLFEKVRDAKGGRIVIEFFENLVLERVLAVRNPFVLKCPVGMASVSQAEPEAIPDGIQVLRPADPRSGPLSCAAPRTHRQEPFVL